MFCIKTLSLCSRILKKNKTRKHSEWKCQFKWLVGGSGEIPDLSAMYISLFKASVITLPSRSSMNTLLWVVLKKKNTHTKNPQQKQTPNPNYFRPLRNMLFLKSAWQHTIKYSFKSTIQYLLDSTNLWRWEAKKALRYKSEEKSLCKVSSC